MSHLSRQMSHCSSSSNGKTHNVPQCPIPRGLHPIFAPNPTGRKELSQCPTHVTLGHRRKSSPSLSRGSTVRPRAQSRGPIFSDMEPRSRRSSATPEPGREASLVEGPPTPYRSRFTRPVRFLFRRFLLLFQLFVISAFQLFSHGIGALSIGASLVIGILVIGHSAAAAKLPVLPPPFRPNPSKPNGLQPYGMFSNNYQFFPLPIPFHRPIMGPVGAESNPCRLL
jgi:hypothetical protein